MPRTHTVAQGEYLAQIAEDHGFADWKTLYNHPLNEALRLQRPRPNVLFPGDVVHIPDPRPKTVDGATDQRHRFVMKSLNRNLLKLVLKDDTGQAIENAPYTLSYRHGARDLTLKGTSGGDGKVEHELPLGVGRARLSLDKLGVSWDLHIGHLDPADPKVEDVQLPRALQARLNNLGFPCGKVDGVIGPRTRRALKEFQRVAMKRADATGELDTATRAALVSQHGC